MVNEFQIFRSINILNSNLGNDLSKIATLHGVKGINFWLNIYDKDQNVTTVSANSSETSNDYFLVSPGYVKANKNGYFKAIGAYPIAEKYYAKGDVIVSGSWNTASNPFSEYNDTVYIFVK